VAIARHAYLGVDYAGEYGGGSREHTGSVTLRWQF